MIKIKAIPFILLGTVVHVGLCIANIAADIGCDTRTNCLSMTTRVGAVILGFPANLVSWLWQTENAKVTSWSFVFLLLNSVLAVTILWFVLKLFLNRGANSVSPPT
jgi:hypothetical protein